MNRLPPIGARPRGVTSLRVLHVQDHTIPQFSGYAFRSRYIVENQRKLGIDAEVLSSARHRDFDSLVEEIDGIRFHRTPWPTGALNGAQLKIPFWRERILTAAMVRRIREVAETFRPDALHAHSPFFNGQAALRAGRALGIPVVYEIRAFWEDDAVDKNKFAEGSFVYRQVRRLETQVCMRADRVVTICGGLKDDLVGRGIDADKVSVVSNGVDMDKFQPVEPDPALAKKLGLDGKVVVGFVGSFFHYEGLPLLVEAVALLKERHPELRVLLVGGGEDEERTREAAKTHGVEDRIVFTGRVPHAEVAAYYALIEVLVYPRLSKRITELVTPLKPLEAFAMGKGVIGSDVGGVKELLEDCDAGRLFRAGSAEALAEALSAWVQTPEAGRLEEREAAKAAVAERRTWIGQVERILPVYQSLTGAELRKSLLGQEK